MMVSHRNVGLVAVVCAMFLFHAGSTLAGGPSGRQVLGKLNIRPDGSLMVWGATGNWSNPDACTDPSAVVMDVSAPGYKERYAMLLAAHLDGRDVAFNLTGCLAIGSITYPQMGSVTIY